jgi:multimeric flavodoxin WrbA
MMIWLMYWFCITRVPDEPRAMAQGISEARARGLKVLCQKVEDTAVEQLLDVDGVIVGSPTYYGTRRPR